MPNKILLTVQMREVHSRDIACGCGSTWVDGVVVVHMVVLTADC